MIHEKIIWTNGASKSLWWEDRNFTSNSSQIMILLPFIKKDSQKKKVDSEKFEERLKEKPEFNPEDHPDFWRWGFTYCFWGVFLQLTQNVVSPFRISWKCHLISKVDVRVLSPS